MQQLSSNPPQANPEVPINENFETLEWASIFGKRHPATTGLTWAYWGGRWGGIVVPDDVITLASSADNYLVADRLTGEVLLAGGSPSEWFDTDNYGRLYKITTGSSTVTAVEDHRAGPGGIFAGGGGVSALAGLDDVNVGTPQDDDVLSYDTADSLWKPARSRRAVSALSTVSNAVAIDAGPGDYFTLALSANVTSITFSNLPGSGKGTTLLVQITQDSTPRTVAWPSSFKWESGVPPSVSTASGAVDMLAITTFDNGTTWRATLAKAFS
jgi:hypothetical protein